MDIQIYGEHLDITDALKNHAAIKCEKFKAIIGNNTVKLRLKLDEKKVAHTKLDIHYKGDDFHIDAKGKDMYASITEAVNKAHKRLHEHNKKIQNHHNTPVKVLGM